MRANNLKSRQFQSLIRLSKMESKALISALEAHLVKGKRKADAARAFDVDPSYLSKSVKRLEYIREEAKGVHS